MAQTTLEKLREIDLHLLTEVVRCERKDPNFTVQDWSVKRLSEMGITNPDGLFRFSGTGFRQSTGERDPEQWSVVLKILKDPEQEQDPRNVWYWQREYLVAQSGLLSNLPGPLVAPEIFAVGEYLGERWIWMELVRDQAKEKWHMEEYIYAAGQIGLMDGKYLSRPTPADYPWLCRDHTRTITTFYDQETDWDHPLVKKYFQSKERQKIDQIWAEKERFITAINALPQVMGHFDTMRRNLLVRVNRHGKKELVGIDWGFFGTGPIGGQLSMMIPNGLLLFEIEPEEFPQVEETAYPAYLQGLRDAGWQGDPSLVRLGYCTWTALWPGSIIPKAMELLSAEETRAWVIKQFGRPIEEVAPFWQRLAWYCIDRADEAREIIDRLRLVK